MLSQKKRGRKIIQLQACKGTNCGAGEMAALPEKPGSIPSTPGRSQLFVTPVLGDPTPSSDLLRYQACKGAYAYMQATYLYP